jgi:hypothetical protein
LSSKTNDAFNGFGLGLVLLLVSLTTLWRLVLLLLLLLLLLIALERTTDLDVETVEGLLLVVRFDCDDDDAAEVDDALLLHFFPVVDASATGFLEKNENKLPCFRFFFCADDMSSGPCVCACNAMQCNSLVFVSSGRLVGRSVQDG